MKKIVSFDAKLLQSTLRSNQMATSQLAREFKQERTLKRKEQRGGNEVIVCICKPVNNMLASSSVISRVSNKSSKFGRTICSLYVRSYFV